MGICRGIMDSLLESTFYIVNLHQFVLIQYFILYENFFNYLSPMPLRKFSADAHANKYIKKKKKFR